MKILTRGRSPLLAAAALALAATLSAPTTGFAQAQKTNLALITGSGNFEFRDHHHVWKFTADGRVTADDSQDARLFLGGISEIYGIKSSGMWRRTADQLCITWSQPAGKAEQCYTLTSGHGTLVKLVGPTTLEGRLEASGPTLAQAERQAPAPAARPYQRIPGAR